MHLNLNDLGPGTIFHLEVGSSANPPLLRVHTLQWEYHLHIQCRFKMRRKKNCFKKWVTCKLGRLRRHIIEKKEGENVSQYRLKPK